MTAYQQLLLDPRWQKKRLLILERDRWTCQCCGASNKTLHVHHAAYLRGKNPWETPDCLLVTLCDECHELEGNERADVERVLICEVRRLLPLNIGVECLTQALLELHGSIGDRALTLGEGAAVCRSLRVSP